MHIISHQRLLTVFCFSVLLSLVSSCSSLISSTSSKLAENLSYTILNSDDPQTVADGAPAYLLLMDSLLRDAQNNTQLLQSTATLYSAYAGIFVTQEKRSARMSDKALSYAEQALCLSDSGLCHIRQMDFERFSLLLSTINRENIATWYVLGSTWAGWIKANSSSMSAIAQVPRVKLIMQRISNVDEFYHGAQVHLYLGVLNTLLPPALGGKPEQGRKHFEKVIAYTQGRNLMAKVLFAEKYARLVFDQSLHDRLLQEVLAADPYVENLTLMNVLAQKKAQQLLDSSTEYF